MVCSFHITFIVHNIFFSIIIILLTVSIFFFLLLRPPTITQIIQCIHLYTDVLFIEDLDVINELQERIDDTEPKIYPGLKHKSDDSEEGEEERHSDKED